MIERDQYPTPDLSIVVPVVERHGDLVRLYTEYAAQVDNLDRSAEFIFVVDYRQREVVPELRELQKTAKHEIILVLLRGSFGESSALTLGLEQARAGTVVTLASYFQVDPEGLAAAVSELEAGADLVVGRRHPRLDSFFNRVQTKIFHGIVKLLTGTRFTDISCGFRAMRPELTKDLAIYGGLHRFIPIFAQRRGFSVVELSLAQRLEDAPTRYYGVAVYLKRLLDVLTVFFLTKFTYRPIRFFGLLGFGLTAVGLGITTYLGIYRLLELGGIANRPLLLLGVLLAVLGLQILAIGLVGEIVIFTHSRQLESYKIAEIIRAPDSERGALPLVVDREGRSRDGVAL